MLDGTPCHSSQNAKMSFPLPVPGLCVSSTPCPTENFHFNFVTEE